MTSKKFVLVVLTIIFLTSSLPVLAEDLTSIVTPKPTGYGGFLRGLLKEQRQEIKDTRQEFKAERDELRTTIVQNRNDLKATNSQTRLERHRNRIRVTYQGLLNSFNRRLEAFNSYLVRIQTRLNEKKAKIGTNQNLTDAQTALDSVKNNLLPTLEADIAKFKTQADSIINSTDPKSLVPQLKEAAKIVQQDFKNVRQKLVEALRLVVNAK